MTGLNGPCLLSIKPSQTTIGNKNQASENVEFTSIIHGGEKHEFVPLMSVR